MKEISSAIAILGQKEIGSFEKEKHLEIVVGNENIKLELSDVEILSEDIPGWLVANEGSITIALDINITEELRHEGIAREFINRIQNIRKDSNFEVTDKVTIKIQKNGLLDEAVEKHSDYIRAQTLGASLMLVDQLDTTVASEVDIDDVLTYVKVEKQ